MNRLEILTENEIKSIHYASLEVLEAVGMFVGEETSLKLLQESGANVDYKRKFVKVPQHLVSEALKKVPKGGRIHYARSPKYDVSTNEHLCFRGSSTAPYTYDIYTGEHRFATKKGLEDTTRLLNALGNIHICFQPYTINDVPTETISQHTGEAMLKTHKSQLE